MQIPTQYLPIMPYLIVPGGFKFLEFTKETLGAVEQYAALRSEGIIMHGEIRIQSAVIMFADVTEHYAHFPGSMFLYLDDVDGLFTKVSARKDVKMLASLEDRPYGRGFGFEDPLGNHWWLNTPM